AISKGRYVLLLNPDTIVLDNALVKMVRFLDSDSGIGALGCKILTVNGEVDFRCARRFPSIWSELFEKTSLAANFPHSRLFGGYLMSYWDHRNDREVDLLLGACIMVRRETIEKIGMMDEDFFMYGDDVEWCYRIKKAGWRVFYYSGAETIHIGGQSRELANMQMSIEALRSMNLFFKKHHGHIYAWIHRILMFFITVGKQLVFHTRYLTVQDTEQRRWYRDKIESHGRVLRWIVAG
ncbi:MAG: glycosyltransferase, partial [Anaerolineae bacterium]